MDLTITPGKILLLSEGVIIGKSMTLGESISANLFVAFVLLLIFLAVQLKARMVQQTSTAHAVDNTDNRTHELTYTNIPRSIDLSEFNHEFKVTKSRTLKY